MTRGRDCFFQDKLPSMAGGEDIGDGPDLSFFDDIRFLSAFMLYPTQRPSHTHLQGLQLGPEFRIRSCLGPRGKIGPDKFNV